MKLLLAAALALSLCSCQQKNDSNKTAPSATKDNVLQQYVEQPINQAKDMAKKVEDQQQKELDQADGGDE